MSNERITHDRFEEFKQQDTSNWTDQEWENFFSYIRALSSQYIDDWEDELYRTEGLERDTKKYVRILEHGVANLDGMQEAVQRCCNRLQATRGLKNF
ncbi:hypothetical protein FQN52_000734 [Onygenales sp. PD_12]|nr:hypothetical protein FQN52_000734 [Onygenales sp. PD_12]